MRPAARKRTRCGGGRCSTPTTQTPKKTRTNISARVTGSTPNRISPLAIKVRSEEYEKCKPKGGVSRVMCISPIHDRKSPFARPSSQNSLSNPPSPGSYTHPPSRNPPCCPLSRSSRQPSQFTRPPSQGTRPPSRPPSHPPSRPNSRGLSSQYSRSLFRPFHGTSPILAGTPVESKLKMGIPILFRNPARFSSSPGPQRSLGSARTVRGSPNRPLCESTENEIDEDGLQTICSSLDRVTFTKNLQDACDMHRPTAVRLQKPVAVRPQKPTIIHPSETVVVYPNRFRANPGTDANKKREE
mmetsp:Transcript_5922/g.14351  ORF Transcript_5922/g.14351 Transcript_5922/m.14351 type:complete len:299 (+) Transcript_5922:269-1165(+)